MALLETFDAVRRSRFVGPLAVATALLLLTANEVSHQRASAVIQAGDDALSTRVYVNRLLRLMLGAESGQRGYLMTGRQEYREPYEHAVRDIEQLLSTIRVQNLRVPSLVADTAQLEELARQKLSELETTLRLYDEGKEEAWRAVIMTDIGREKMRSLEKLAQVIAAKETVLHEASRNALSTTLLLQRIGIAALVILALVALLLYLHQTSQSFRAGELQRRLLKAERDNLEVEVERRTRDVTEIARHLQSAREDERSRLARELHDELGGLLTAAKLDVARMKSRLEGAVPPVQERIAHLVTTLDAGIALKRRIIENLRPSSLQNLGLKAALEILASEYASMAGVALECNIEEVALDADASLSVYRLVQEALTNISKYASARTVRVRVATEGAGVRVAVEDDGAGFDAQNTKAGAHGLAGMRFRIESHGGNVEVRSQPGQGTTIVAWLPLSEVLDSDFARDAATDPRQASDAGAGA